MWWHSKFRIAKAKQIPVRRDSAEEPSVEETLSLFTNFMTCEGDISTFLFRKLTLASNGLGIDFRPHRPGDGRFRQLWKFRLFKKPLFFLSRKNQTKNDNLGRKLYGKCQNLHRFILRSGNAEIIVYKLSVIVKYLKERPVNRHFSSDFAR